MHRPLGLCAHAVQEVGMKHRKFARLALPLSAMIAGCMSEAAQPPGFGSGAGYAPSVSAPEPVGHPGRGPWEVVPEANVLDVCHLDPAALARADKLLGQPWVAIRYGRVCHAYKA